MNVYEKCPVLESENFLLRKVCLEDSDDLLKVYSDEKAVPFLTAITATETIFIIQLSRGCRKL